MNAGNKAYYLKDIDFAVLLSLYGVKELYGFRMEKLQEYNIADIYRTLFELEKSKMIAFKNEKQSEATIYKNVIIKPELVSILDVIKNADRMLFYESNNGERPSQCAYLGSRAVLVTDRNSQNGINRVEEIALDMLPEIIVDCGFCLEELISDQSLYCDEECKDLSLEQMANTIFSGIGDREEINNNTVIKHCIRLVLLASRKCICQYLLVKSGLSDYLIITDKDGSRIFLYSRRMLLDVLHKNLLSIPTYE